MVRYANSNRSSDTESTVDESSYSEDYEPFQPTAEETTALKELYHEYMRSQLGKDPSEFLKPRRPDPKYSPSDWNRMKEIWADYMRRSWEELIYRCRCRTCGELPGLQPHSMVRNREVRHGRLRRPNGRPGWLMVRDLEVDRVLDLHTFYVPGVPQIPGNPPGWMDMEELLFDRPTLFEMAECKYKAEAKETRCSNSGSSGSFEPRLYEPRVRWSWDQRYA